MSNSAKISKVTLSVLNFENVSDDDIIYYLENTKYVNVHVLEIQSAKIEDWGDDHPLNKTLTFGEEFNKIFK